MKKIYSIFLLSLLSFASFGQNGQINNGGFEIWQDTYLYESPTNWKSTNTEEFWGLETVFKSNDAQDGLSSARLEAIVYDQDTLAGYVLQGDLDQSGPAGGVPYTDNFEAISVHYKVDLNPDDTLFMIMVRYDNGVPVDFRSMPVAYGTQTTWTPTLLYVGNTPQDELFLGFVLNNPLGGPRPAPGSWAMVDNVQFYAGSVLTSPYPNNSFEDWTTTTVEDPTNWYSINWLLAGPGLENVTKTTDANSGTYAVEMTTVFEAPDTIASLLSMAPIDVFSWNPFANAPYNADPTQFSGAYKYAPANGDQASIDLIFYENGNIIGTHSEQLTAQATYTTFSSNLSLTGTPDSIMFLAYSGDNPGSVLKLDDLQFSGGNVGIEEQQMIAFDLYPNPTTDVVNISLPEKGVFEIEIVGMDGALAVKRNNCSGNQQVDLSVLSNGIYIVHISNGQATHTKKLIIQ